MKVQCPYCEEDTVVLDPDEFIDGGEYQCDECEHYFYLKVEYYPTGTARKAACLNGGAHLFKPIHGWPQHFLLNKVRCKNCGYSLWHPELFSKLIVNDSFWNHYFKKEQE